MKATIDKNTRDKIAHLFIFEFDIIKIFFLNSFIFN